MNKTLLVGQTDFIKNIPKYNKIIEEGITDIIILSNNKPIMKIIKVDMKDGFVILEDFVE